MVFRLIILSKKRYEQLSSMPMSPFKATETPLFKSNRSVGISPCPAMLRHSASLWAAPPRPAPDMSAFGSQQVWYDMI